LNVLITGAGGFLGRHVVAEFLRRGHAVRALVRPSTNVAPLAWPAEVEVRRADLLGKEDLAPSLAGVDAVVHLAASVRGSDADQYAAAVEGTERLLKAMADSGVKRLVLASSFSVYDWSAIEGTLDEDSPLEPPEGLAARDGYAVAKAAQERTARDLAGRFGIDLTVLRPGFIWGRDHSEVGGLGQKVGPVQVVFGPSTRLPMTHVENCAHVFALATEDPRAIGRTYNVVDDEGPTTADFLRDYLGGTGQKRVTVPLGYGPAFVAVRLAHGLLGALTLGKKKLPGLLIPTRFEARFKPLRFTNARLRDELGWAPPLGPAERAARTYGPVPAAKPDRPINLPA
jgi:UDP-glucose 4-epimerase